MPMRQSAVPVPRREHEIKTRKARLGRWFAKIEFKPRDDRRPLIMGDMVHKPASESKDWVIPHPEAEALFKSGLESIRLVIKWPGYEHETKRFTTSIPIDPSHVNRKWPYWTLIVGIAMAYDEFLQAGVRRKVLPQLEGDDTLEEWHDLNIYQLDDLILTGLWHCGDNVFQAEVLHYDHVNVLKTYKAHNRMASRC